MWMPQRHHRCRRHGPGALCFLILSFFAPSLKAASATPTALNIGNFTIDDASGGDDFHSAPITRSSIPPDLTADTIARWTNQACVGCPNPPDLTSVFNGTYTALYLPPGDTYTYDISFQFNGSAIYVYLILSNQAGTECDFILDDVPMQRYMDTTEDPYQYNTLAFSATGLEMTVHTLTIKTEGKPSTANYLNFDFVNFTRLKHQDFSSATDQTDTPEMSPTPTSSAIPSASSPPSNHLTAKSIAGGVIGGFIAVVALILAAAFYRRRRMRPPKPEEYISPFNSGGSSSAPGTISSAERHHLIPIAIPQPRPHHHHTNTHTQDSYDTHTRQLSHNHNTYNYEPNLREHVRQERQREINSRLESAKREVRNLKAAFMVEQQVAQARGLQAREYGNRDDGDDDGGHMPAFRIVPGGMGQPGREPARPDPMLVDMRDQMRVMMDQIQYLRVQQNSPYAQGLTDEPPPGYMEVLNPANYRP